MTLCSALRLVTLFVICILRNVLASAGDQSYFFQRCRASCIQDTCRDLEGFRAKQSVDLQLLQWSCEDECEYKCMWPTVEAFKNDKLPIPQFHGKWPFKRVCGVQEPASAIFSVLNFLAHLRIISFARNVPSSAPMYLVWIVNSMIALNAWFWSTVFHTRDKPFTEMMDYFCAFSLVLTNLMALFFRVMRQEQKKKAAVLLVALGFFTYHVYYLALVKFDYGYNMKVNLTVGVCNLVGWLWWCNCNWRHVYVQKCALVMVGTTLLMLLEVFDFPPIFWTLDAHSLWHFGTAPLTLVWLSFITDDTRRVADEMITLDAKPHYKKAL